MHLFGANEFRKLAGISAETLRHYTDCGIIDSVEVAANNYKKYSPRNLVDVLHARMCRGLDLGLSHIVHKTDYALEEQERLLREHEADLVSEALELDRKLGRLRQHIGYLAAARSSLGQVKERTADEVPSLYWLTLVGEGAAESSRAQGIVEQWMAHPQYTHVALRSPKAALLDPAAEDLPVGMGIGIRAEFAPLLKFDAKPPAAFFPRARNLGTVIAVADPFALKKSDIRCLLEKAESLGCSVESDLMGRLCTSLETERGRLYYFSVSVCIKNIAPNV